jgi:hypothetical protein
MPGVNKIKTANPQQRLSFYSGNIRVAIVRRAFG